MEAGIAAARLIGQTRKHLLKGAGLIDPGLQKPGAEGDACERPCALISIFYAMH